MQMGLRSPDTDAGSETELQSEASGPRDALLGLIWLGARIECVLPLKAPSRPLNLSLLLVNEAKELEC